MLRERARAVKRGNLLVTTEKTLIPIDHGLCLPDVRELGEAWFEWLQWEQCKHALSKEEIDWVNVIDIDRDANILNKLHVRPEAIMTLYVTTHFLKLAVRSGWTLFDIGSYMQRPNLDPQSRSGLELLIEKALSSSKELEKTFYENPMSVSQEFIESFVAEVKKEMATSDTHNNGRNQAIDISHLKYNLLTNCCGWLPVIEKDGDKFKISLTYNQNGNFNCSHVLSANIGSNGVTNFQLETPVSKCNSMFLMVFNSTKHLAEAVSNFTDLSKHLQLLNLEICRVQRLSMQVAKLQNNLNNGVLALISQNGDDLQITLRFSKASIGKLAQFQINIIYSPVNGYKYDVATIFGNVDESGVTAALEKFTQSKFPDITQMCEHIQLKAFS